MSTPSPFEYLLVFAIVFVAGLLTSAYLRKTAERAARKAIGHAQSI